MERKSKDLIILELDYVKRKMNTKTSEAKRISTVLDEKIFIILIIFLAFKL